MEGSPPHPDFDAVQRPGVSTLDPGKIVATAERLEARIAERFPQSNLRRVAAELVRIAREAAARAEWIASPNIPLRASLVTLIAAVTLVLGGLLANLNLRFEVGSFTELVQTVESAINDLVLFGAGVFFLITWESRIKRGRALRAVHELRSIAHIIDMHQLTKDPEQLMPGGPRTPSSPERSMSRFELLRYLDYCSEMLSLSSKLAALYVQKFDDPVVLSAVDQVEDLTNGLSRKLWQKINIIVRRQDAELEP
jgi:hypothetical protein